MLGRLHSTRFDALVVDDEEEKGELPDGSLLVVEEAEQRSKVRFRAFFARRSVVVARRFFFRKFECRSAGLVFYI